MDILSFGQYAYTISTFTVGRVFPDDIVGKENLRRTLGKLLVLAGRIAIRNAADGVCTRYWPQYTKT